jgi:hypothetical protein
MAVVKTGERRKYIRFACKTELKAIVDFNPDIARRALGKLPPFMFRRGEHGVIRDVSEKGIAIEADHLLPEGLTIKMAIDNPITPPIETGAKIVWSKELSDDTRKYAMGMSYWHMKEKQRRNLEKLIAFLQTIPD